MQLLRELGLNGRYYTKEINGRTYVILKGYAGLRKVLSASRYLTANPKIIVYGLTSAARAAGATVNVIITFVVLVPMEIIRHLMGEQTLSQVFGNILTSTMIAALSSAASFGVLAVGALVSATVPVWIVVAGAVVVGLLVGKRLSDLSDALNISGFVAMTLDGAMRHLAEEEARRARSQRILGQFDRTLPADSGWRGLLGPR
ncbi:hypothetical protein [Inquilinus sp. OTU3971]|uniref:hypothetical protein n=1 Tax=Inquilinus sp. OTU3971 TaxID=3043855 RepID=UPI00313D5933